MDLSRLLSLNLDRLTGKTQEFGTNYQQKTRNFRNL